METVASPGHNAVQENTEKRARAVLPGATSKHAQIHDKVINRPFTRAQEAGTDALDVDSADQAGRDLEAEGTVDCRAA